MKNYNFKKAFDFIEEHKENVKSASLGMNEDWTWTSEDIYEDGKYVVDLTDEHLMIGGINGSTWATPTLEITYKNGITERMGCYKGKSDSGDRVEMQKQMVNGDSILSRPEDDPEFSIKKNL